MTEETQTPPAPRSFSRRLSTILANSPLLRSGRELHQKYRDDWQMLGSFVNKIKANLWLLLHDYGTGEFPPQKVNREEFLESEKNQLKNITFETPAQRIAREMRKPFAISSTPGFLRGVASLLDGLQKRGVHRGAKILELGCGSGWLLEMLVQHGYTAVGITITPEDIGFGESRAESLRLKQLQVDLQFKRIEMESVHRIFQAEFDVAIFHAALHHAFSWREALASATQCLKPGGWLVLMAEPSWLHTFVCYRSARIFRTLEIGFRRRDLRRELEKLGYHNIEIRRPVFLPGIKGILGHLQPFFIVDGSIEVRSFFVYAQKSKIAGST